MQQVQASTSKPADAQIHASSHVNLRMSTHSDTSPEKNESLETNRKNVGANTVISKLNTEDHKVNHKGPHKNEPNAVSMGDHTKMDHSKELVREQAKHDHRGDPHQQVQHKMEVKINPSHDSRMLDPFHSRTADHKMLGHLPGQNLQMPPQQKAHIDDYPALSHSSHPTHSYANHGYPGPGWNPDVEGHRHTHQFDQRPNLAHHHKRFPYSDVKDDDLEASMFTCHNDQVVKFNKDEIRYLDEQNVLHTVDRDEMLDEVQLDEIDNDLPSTAILLRTEGGSKVYVVGTVHFSLDSQKDVAKVIRAVKPDYLVLELCASRAYMLQWNEEQVLKEAQNLNFRVMKQILQSAGIIHGGLYLLLLSMTIQITKQLGIAPGGEFRAAYREAMDVPNCIVWFGDRPIQITLQRMMASLSWWQLVKLAMSVLFNREKISKEEVESCRNKDVLEQALLGFSRELPDFARVMVNERDAYLTYSLQLAAKSSEPNRVVGVVGIGHLQGIKDNWEKVSLSNVQKILSIPPQKKSSKIIRATLKFTLIGLVLYGGHRLALKTNFYSKLFRSLKESIEDWMTESLSPIKESIVEGAAAVSEAIRFIVSVLTGDST